MQRGNGWFGAGLASVLVGLALAGSAWAEEEVPATAAELAEMRARIEALEDALAEAEAAAEEEAEAAEEEACAAEDEEPPWYERFEIALGATGILQGTSGVNSYYNPDGNTWDGAMSFDFEIMAPIEDYGAFFAGLEAGAGAGLDEAYPSLFGFNGDAVGDSELALGELWYEHNFINSCVRLRAGKVDLSSDFDTNVVANSETDQFLAGVFINNPALEFPADTGLGAMLWVEPSDKVALGVGVAEANGGWDDVDRDVFTIVELDLKPQSGGRQGNYRFYGWQNGAAHESLVTAEDANLRNRGFGVSFDQEVSGALTLFARYGNQRGNVSQVEDAWSVGFQCTRGFAGCPDDFLGMAYGVSKLSEEWKALGEESGIDSSDEQVWEFYYNHKVNDHLNISPDFQWARNPNGDAGHDDAFVFGVRAQVAF